MKLRRNHIIGIVIAGVSVVVVAIFVVESGGGPGMSSGRTDEFLDSVRQQAMTDVATYSNTDGSQPGSELDRSFVPKIELDSYEIHVGTIPNDGSFTTTIPVHNVGKKDLVIAKIDTQCRCTQGEMIDPLIKPGRSGTMRITIDPNIIPGFISSKILTISTNDPANLTVNLTVKADVDPEFEISADTVDFGTIISGTTSRQTLIIRQIGDEEIIVNSVAAIGDPIPGVSYSFEPRPEEDWLAAGKPEFDIHVDIGPDALPGMFSQYFNIMSTSKRVPRFRSGFHAIIAEPSES
jgi:hypothetical protein